MRASLRARSTVFRGDRRVANLAPAVPAWDARQLGLFRIVFGLMLLYTVHGLAFAAWEPPPGGSVPVLADWGWARALAADPSSVGVLEQLIYLLLVCFIVGFASRVSFVGATAALAVWTLVRLHHTGVHNWGVAFVALLMLLPVRWGDGLSVDSLLSRLRGRPRDGGLGRHYGYAQWAVGLIFCLAMLAAGLSKMRGGGMWGVGWVATGAVRYHFVADAANAVVDWGLWIAARPWAAVLASLAAVLTEATAVAALFVRRPGLRLLMGLPTAALLVGFYLFHGELWRGWWMLWFAYFIPWGDLAGTRNEDYAFCIRPLTVPQSALIAVACLAQLGAWSFRLEIPPLVSDYPMYSHTFASTDEFDAAGDVREYRFELASMANVRDVTDELDDLGVDAFLRDTIIEYTDRGQLDADRQQELEAVAAEIIRELAPDGGRVDLLFDDQGFDWSRGQVYWRARGATRGTLDLGTGALLPN